VLWKEGYHEEGRTEKDRKEEVTVVLLEPHSDRPPEREAGSLFQT